MATFVRLQGILPAVNMDHVVEIDWADKEKGTIALTVMDGRVMVIGGDQAQRILVWVRSFGAVPLLSAYREGQP
ncbi:MAG TPA: hypothetical protein VM537_17030 [Anaerolineae bacterium]|nr:hypothetical protein [Anaerolineae bacterium]